jgi:hypothetical protein
LIVDAILAPRLSEQYLLESFDLSRVEQVNAPQELEV